MTEKKPGARDISDLKARLGLKNKGGAAPSGPASAAAPTGAAPPRPGAIAPPGMAAPPGIAPPPGMAAPPGAQPAPDPSKDPFGAMNAMAQPGAVARDIVVINDGSGEKVDSAGKAAKYGRLAGMLLVPLVLGVVMGSSGSDRRRFNEVIEGSAVIRDDIRTLNRFIAGDLQEGILLEAKARGPGGKSYKANDGEMNKALGALKFPKFNKEVFHAKMDKLPDGVVENILYYYQGAAQLKQMVADHATQAKVDAKAFEAGTERMKKYAPTRFGAIVTPDSAKGGLPPSIELVELGRPLCGGKPGACPTPDGFQYRTDTAGTVWRTGKFAVASGSSVESGKLLRLGLNKVVTQAIVGGGASIAMTGYKARIRAIDEKVVELVEVAGNLIRQLDNSANASKKFTFFM